MMIRRIAALAVLIAAGLATAPYLAAQQRGPMGDPAAMIDDQMEALTKAVGLSDEQAAAIRPIYEGQAAKMMELMQAARASGSREGVREQVTALRDETHDQVEAQLTEDQIEPYKAFLEKQAEEREQRMRERRPPGT